jgi:hypothetical protein
MAIETHGIGDRRKHGLGDNIRKVGDVHAPKVKQASRARVSQAAVFNSSAGYHAATTRMPRVPRMRMGKVG